MPIGYTRDEIENQILLNFEGLVEPGHLSVVISWLVGDGTWAYPCVCDMRGTRGQSSLAALQVFLSYVPREMPPGGPRRGPIAIIVTDPALYAGACTLASTLGAKLVVEVFHDRDEASQWLADVVRV